MTVAVDEEVRGHPRRILLAPGHPAHGRSVRESDGCRVTETSGESGEIAEATDPRRGS